MAAATSIVIQTQDDRDKPESRVRLVNEGLYCKEFCSIEVGVHKTKADFFINSDVQSLQEWAREFMHVANALFRMSLDKEGSEYDEGLPATDIAAHPELEVAAAMEVEF